MLTVSLLSSQYLSCAANLHRNIILTVIFLCICLSVQTVQLVYSILAAVNDVFGSSTEVYSKTSRLQRLRDVFFTALSLPIAMVRRPRKGLHGEYRESAIHDAPYSVWCIMAYTIMLSCLCVGTRKFPVNSGGVI